MKRTIKLSPLGESCLRINTISNLWPGECLEEIKELYGRQFVGSDLISINCVLKEYQKGLEACFESRQKDFAQAPFVVIADEVRKRLKEEKEKQAIESIDALCKKMEAIDLDHQLPLPCQTRRNAPCPCGSGKKFKKCCLNAKQTGQKGIQFESYQVTWEQMNHEHQEEEDQELFETIVQDFQNDPESSIETLLELMEKYPDDPALYNILYKCYLLSEEYWEAHELLLKTVQRFPDYLFGLVDYASYLIRRGDYDKVPTVFKEAKTLLQLYPERDLFHISEVKAFHYVMGSYFLHMGNFEQAKIYLSIIERNDPSCMEAQTLRNEIEQRSKRQLLDALLDRVRTNPEAACVNKTLAYK